MPVVRSGDGQEPLHCDGHHDEDATAETEPVERVVEVGEDWEECLGVDVLVVVPHYIKHSEHQVKCIEDIECDQQIVETDFLLKIK